MVTWRNAKRFLTPLIEANPDLVWEKPWVYVTPVRHVVSALCLESVTFVKRGRPIFVMQPLFFPELWLSGLISVTDVAAPMAPEEYGKQRTLPDDEYSAWLKDFFEVHALPLMRRNAADIQAMAAFYAAPPRWAWSHWREPEHFVTAVALGDLDRARAILSALAEPFPEGDDTTSISRLWGLARRLTPLVESGDLGAIAEVLHAVERASADTLGIARLHERTPFPFEKGSLT